MENEQGEASNQNEQNENSNNENQSIGNNNVGRSLVSRMRMLVSQSTLREDALDNHLNNFPQHISDDENIQSSESEEDQEEEDGDSERLFEEYMQQEAAAQPNQSHFDVELPMQHAYLGETENIGGFTLYEPNKIYNIPVCAHHSIFFPGEILPMIMLQDRFFSRESEEEGLTFGLIFQGDNDEGIYGVTCQVYEKGVDNNGHITVKSRANQRFIVIKTEDGQITTTRNHTFYAKVKILPEIFLKDPLLLTISNGMMKHNQNTKHSNNFKNFLAASTRWPRFVFDQYSVVKTCEKIERYLAMLNIESPTDPTLKSFWLARNVPLNQADRLKIFKNNCVNRRLLLIGESLNFMCYFLCKRCKNKIAIYNDIFAMSKGNVNANYCNPAGYIHETLTVHKTFESAGVSAVRMVDRPSTDFSWFPGYAWQIAICSKCESHIGWKFLAVNNKNLRPRTFFGLSCKSLLVSPEGQEEDQQSNSDDNNINDDSE